MRNNETPCFGCTAETGRHPGCHDHCKRYMDAKERYDAEQKWLKAQNKADSDASYRIRQDAAVWNNRQKNAGIGRKTR